MKRHFLKYYLDLTEEGLLLRFKVFFEGLRSTLMVLPCNKFDNTFIKKGPAVFS